jgi:CRISPR-associated protein Cmr1
LNQESEHRFKEDHDWSKDVRPHDFHPRRVVFGLPHNYGPGNRQSVKSEKYERRSSPLIFHVHKIGSEYLGVCTLLKSDFLPEGERINAGGKNVPAKIEWDLLHEFLDGSDKKGNVRFANRESVL